MGHLEEAAIVLNDHKLTESTFIRLIGGHSRTITDCEASFNDRCRDYITYIRMDQSQRSTKGTTTSSFGCRTIISVAKDGWGRRMELCTFRQAGVAETNGYVKAWCFWFLNHQSHFRNFNRSWCAISCLCSWSRKGSREWLERLFSTASELEQSIQDLGGWHEFQKQG